jgi:hypothetical protein
VGIPTWEFYDNASELASILRKRGEHEWADEVERFPQSETIKRYYFCAGYVVYLDAYDNVIKIDAILLTGVHTPKPIIEVVDIRNWHVVRSVDLNKT